MAQQYESNPQLMANPASYAAAIVNGTNFAATSRGIWVGVAGNVNVVMEGGGTVLFTGALAGTVIPVRATQVASTSTTATNLVALW